MTAKRRTPIPDEVSAKALFQADRTCCVCRIRGKRVQLHHLNGKPDDHRIDNLAVLCFDCHDDTHILGGVGRSLTAAQVVAFRDDWLERAQARRTRADQLAAEAMAGSPEATSYRLESDANAAKPANGGDYPHLKRPRSELRRFVASLPAFKRGIRAQAQAKWDSGVTAEMLQGCYDYIDALEGILVKLAQWYPEDHFDGVDPREFISRMTASRFEWHRAHLEPEGRGSGGTIMGPIIGGYVIDDLEAMVRQMVQSLTQGISGEDSSFTAWHLDWDQ